MAKMAKILLAVAAVVAVVELAMATNYTVGAPSGSWNLQTNLTQWAESNTFHVGDVLNFSYNPSEHDVLEVTQANFDSCNTSNPISTYTDGNTVITLTEVGSRYFICGFTGHCSAGQKVQINVVSGSSTSPSPTSGSTSPVASPPGGSPPDSAATSVTAGAGLVFGLAALLAF
ncbi:mavicyanin-like [Carex rostrata]